MEKFDWKSLPFGYMKTEFNIRCIYKNGEWGKLEVSASEYIDVHIAEPVCITDRRHLRG
jgi:branched-chain amino acid aminotransferase